MSLSSTRGLVRVAKNPGCEVQAAMVLDRIKEPEFFRRVTGRDYAGEYGERVSARRRGTKFEAELHRNNAAGLRKVLGPHFKVDAESMVVRNLAEEVPGPPTEMRAVRFQRTRRIVADLAAGRSVPDIVIQPQLRLSTGSGGRDFEYVSPDFIVLDPDRRIFVPGEEKSFIIRNNVADSADLELARLQAGVQVLALRAEAAAHGLGDRVTNRALFIMATPYGLSPAPVREEAIDAAVYHVERAVDSVILTRERLTQLRTVDHTQLENLIEELDSNFQESCVGSCILAEVCAERIAGRVGTLGDAAADFLGPEMTLARLWALLDGKRPRSPREVQLLPRLIDAARTLGYDVGARKTA